MTKYKMFGGNLQLISIILILGKRSVQRQTAFALENEQKQPPEVFYKKGAPKNFTKFTGKHLC